MKSQKLAVFIVAATFALSAQVGAQHEDHHGETPSTADLKVLVFSGTGWYRHPDIPKTKCEGLNL